MKLKHLLLCALGLHLAAAAGAYWVGRAQAWPGAFDADGVATFASDGRRYQSEVSALEETLKREGVAAWLRAAAPVHVKLYSLSYALFSPLFGRTTLSAEPLNLLYYLATLLLVFALGREVYDARAGLLAAALYAALLPSFLLHTTQLLRDPLFVVLALALVLAALKLMANVYGLRKALLVGALGGSAAAALWLVRSPTWWVVLSIIYLALFLSAVRQLRTRAALKGNLAGLALMLAVAVSASYLLKPYETPKEKWSPNGAGTSVDSDKTQRARGPFDLPARLVRRVRKTRAAFVEQYPNAESNIDPGVKFEGLSDVFAYLPRAFLIGMCAPFPGMWLRAGGQVGTAGRLLSGCETLLMYMIELLALCGLWHRRRDPRVWFLALVGFIGATALGLTVVNVGTLYRLRYVFWALFVVVAADTISRLFASRLAARRERVSGHRRKTVNIRASDATESSTL